MSIRLLVALYLSLFTFQLQVDSTRTQTGYYYPVGTDNLQISSCGPWLTKPVGATGGCYPFSGYYHIGVDLWADEGDDVRPLLMERFVTMYYWLNIRLLLRF